MKCYPILQTTNDACIYIAVLTPNSGEDSNYMDSSTTATDPRVQRMIQGNFTLHDCKLLEEKNAE